MMDEKLKPLIPLLRSLPTGKEETPAGTLVVNMLFPESTIRHVAPLPSPDTPGILITLSCESSKLDIFMPCAWDSPEAKRILDRFMDAVRAYISSLSREDRAKLLADSLRMKS